MHVVASDRISFMENYMYDNIVSNMATTTTTIHVDDRWEPLEFRSDRPSAAAQAAAAAGRVDG